MKVSIIAAVANNRAIGKDNKLLWHLPDDLRFFKETTLGHPVITGRRNYESIPEKYRPLKGRENIVLTSNSNYEAPGARLANSLEEAIEIARGLDEEEIFVMGGGKVYYEAIKKDLVDRMYLTLVRADFDADTFFPNWEQQKWKELECDHHPKDEKHDYSFDICVFDRVSEG